MTDADHHRARRLLARRDPVMRALVRRIGPCGLADSQHADPFESLVQAIVWQQLSWKAALTIYRRFQAIVDGDRCPTPREILDAPEDAMRSAGLSRPKIRYLKGLAAKTIDGSLPLGALETMSDEQVIEALTEVKGIGRWSAEMVLIFKLHRPDVLPLDDLAIQKAIQREYGMRKLPSAKRMRQLGERWRPYRSVASWYLWESLDVRPPGAGQ